MSDYKPKLSVLGHFAHDTGTPVVTVARLLDATDPVNHGDVLGQDDRQGGIEILEGNNNGKRLGAKVIDEAGELYVSTGPEPTDAWKNQYAGVELIPVLPIGSFNVDEEFS